MANILKDKKAEFFIISAVIIASILISIQGHFGGYSEADFTEVVTSREIYIFNNVKDEIKDIETDSGNCEEMHRKLIEFEDITEKQIKERGYDFNLQVSNCNASGYVDVNMALISSDYTIGDKFSTNP
ncbi:MAG: hypothetical protein ABEK36_04220 [Candidatus Aenigmatarchaeota archaeon]